MQNPSSIFIFEICQLSIDATQKGCECSADNLVKNLLQFHSSPIQFGFIRNNPALLGRAILLQKPVDARRILLRWQYRDHALRIQMLEMAKFIRELAPFARISQTIKISITPYFKKKRFDELLFCKR